VLVKTHLVEELSDLAPVKEMADADEIFSQLVILLNKFELLWETFLGSLVAEIQLLPDPLLLSSCLFVFF